MSTVYTNLFTNPRPPSSSGTGWGVAAGTGGTAAGTQITGSGGPGGDSARRVTWSVGTSNLTGGTYIGLAALPIAATAGSTYSGTMYVRCSKAQTVVGRLSWADSAYTILGTADGTPVSLSANTWTEVKVQGMVAMTGTVNARFNVVVTTGGSNWAAGDTLDGQAGTLIEGATVPQPFHGSLTNDATHTYAWTGTTDASTSTLTVPDPFGPPTGLTATVISSSAIDVSWNPVTSATGYDVERDGSIISAGFSGTTYHDTGLTAGTTYSYRVRAVQ